MHPGPSKGNATRIDIADELVALCACAGLFDHAALSPPAAHACVASPRGQC